MGARALATAIVFWLVVLSAAACAGGGVTVEGNRFLRDGRPWVAEGVTLVGFVAPEAQLRPFYARAREQFGPELLDAIRVYGADLVRFQVSQTGLDPQSQFFDPDYRGEVLAAIRQTRVAGFNVIVSMQWQRPSGFRDPTGMPSATTRRAWRQLAGVLAEDRGILLEVFNEPALVQATAENWERWRKDMQSLIDVLREAGSQNVLLVGGSAIPIISLAFRRWRTLWGRSAMRCIRTWWRRAGPKRNGKSATAASPGAIR